MSRMSWFKIDLWWSLSLLPSVIVIGLLAFLPEDVMVTSMGGIIMMAGSMYLGYAIFNDGTAKYRRRCREEQLDTELPPETVEGEAVQSE